MFGIVSTTFDRNSSDDICPVCHGYKSHAPGCLGPGLKADLPVLGRTEATTPQEIELLAYFRDIKTDEDRLAVIKFARLHANPRFPARGERAPTNDQGDSDR